MLSREGEIEKEARTTRRWEGSTEEAGIGIVWLRMVLPSRTKCIDAIALQTNCIVCIADDGGWSHPRKTDTETVACRLGSKMESNSFCFCSGCKITLSFSQVRLAGREATGPQLPLLPSASTPLLPPPHRVAGFTLGFSL